MSRRKSAVVLLQPATPMLRRSARLIARQNRVIQERPRTDLASHSEPPRKIRRRIEGEASAKRLVYSSPKSNISFEGLRRSLRVSNRKFSDANKEKATKPISGSSSSCALRRSPRFSSGGGCSLNLESSFARAKSGNSVLSRCSTNSVSSERDSVRSRGTSRTRPKIKHAFRCNDGEEQVSVGLSQKKSRGRSRPKTKQMVWDCDDQEEQVSERKHMRIEEENGVPKVDQGKRILKEDDEGVKRKNKLVDEGQVSERKHMKTEEENGVPKADQGKIIVKENEEGVKRKNKSKLVDGWTEELDLALQGAYLTARPSPNFWKKVSKMVPGKSAQQCFDRVNSDLNTPRQLPPRSRARKTNLSPILQFSLSASKLLKPNSPKTKIRHRRNNLSKKTIRHLLEKQTHMDQGLGFDLFSVFEPGTTSSLLSTPVEKGQRLPRIVETPLPCSRFASKDQTATLVSPPVLKQLKNKALHEKYIDHLHVREAKRKTESTRLAGKENIRPVDIQKKDSVKAVKDSLLFDVQDAVQKLKGLEAENSSSSSESNYDRGETDEDDESI